MDKVNEMTLNGKYFKFYNCGGNIEPIKLLKELKMYGLEINKFFLKEDAEMDMQMMIGEYTLEDLENKPSLHLDENVYNFSIPATIYGKNVEIHFFNNSNILYMVTDDKDLELTELFQKKSNKLRF